MNTDSDYPFLDQLVRTLQIIVAALAGGAAVFAAIALVMNEGPDDNSFITYFAIGMTILDILVWAVVPGILERSHCRKIADGNIPESLAKHPITGNAGEAGALGAVYMTRTIVAAAILQGVVFLNLIAYMLEGRPLSLILAGVLLLMLMSHFPTRGKVEYWLQQKQRLIAQQREMQTSGPSDEGARFS